MTSTYVVIADRTMPEPHPRHTVMAAPIATAIAIARHDSSSVMAAAENNAGKYCRVIVRADRGDAPGTAAEATSPPAVNFANSRGWSSFHTFHLRRIASR